MMLKYENGLKVRPARILMVEDDPGDQELTRRALEEGNIANDLYIAEDGEEGLDFLLRQGEFTGMEDDFLPDLVLLDLNMPRMDGREFLQKLREYKQFDQLPIVIMTTSNQESDIVSSYDLGVKSYITKPIQLEDFVKVIQTMGRYWLQIVVPPPQQVNIDRR